MQDLRITTGTALYTANFTPPNALFPSPGALLLPFKDIDTNFKDYSDNKHTITRYGDTIQTEDQSKWYSRSAYFDGSGDYLEVPNHSSFDFGSGDFTIEFWIRWSTVPGAGGYVTLVVKRTTIDSNNSFSCWYSGGSEKYGWTYTTDGTTYQAITGLTTHTPSPNTWYHIAYVRSGNNLDLYIDGVKQTTQPFNVTLFTSTANLRVGDSQPSANPLHGYLQDLRITKGTALYTANFNVPLALTDEDPHFSSVSLFLKMNGTNNSQIFTDSSYSPKAITVYGSAKISTDHFKYGGASGYFNGSSDYLMIDNSAFNFGTAPFTIEFWVKLGTNFGSWPYLLATSPYNSGTGFYIAVNGPYTGWGGLGLLGFNGSGTLTYAPSVQSTSVVRNDTWHHIAITRQGAVTQLFVNGVVESTHTAAGTANYGTTTSRLMNDSTGGGLGSLEHGYIDDLRVTIGVARYTHNFQPPQRELAMGAPIVINYWLLPDYVAALQSPILDFSIVNHLDYYITTKNFFYGGDQYIEGTVTVNGVPVRRKVRLYLLESGDMIAETWSNATTGNYRFDNLSANLQYYVWGYDHTHEFNPESNLVQTQG
jgi:hypothetical protein